MSASAVIYKKAFVALLLLGSIAIILLFSQHNTDTQSSRQLEIPLGSEVIYFTFGYAETLADSTWLRAVQNFSGCEQDRGGSSFAQSGARIGLNRTPACSRSWLYRMLNLVLELAPRFHIVAQIGPTVLSAVIDDIDGASELYLKAIRLYPEDWVILSRAASHFALEIEDRPLAARLYLQAVKYGAPTWMALYASKLWEQDGQKELGKKILMQFRDNSRLTDRDRSYIEEKLGPTK